MPVASLNDPERAPTIKLAVGAVIALALVALGWTLFASRSNQQAAKRFEQSAVPAARPGADPAVMPGGYGDMMKARAMENLKNQQQGQAPLR